MNRKKTSKLKKLIETQVSKLSPFDNPENWLTDNFEKSPWSKEQTANFQKRLDSAFEAENAIVLAWSGDRNYGDAFYNEKGELERKPVLLFAEEKINDRDYLYISCPRFVLLEVHHGSQLEDGWDEASFVTNEYGKPIRIRPEKPPQFFYKHFKVIATHDTPSLIGDEPLCCQRMMVQNKICYGRYREPSDADIAFVGETRKRLNKMGIFQRNDTERSAKLLETAALSTKHFIKRAQEQKALRVQEAMLNNYEVFFDDILEKNPMSPREVRAALKEAFDQQNTERFA